MRRITGTLNGNVSTEIPETVFAEKIKRRFMFNNFFLIENHRAFCEIMWKRFVEPDRPQMTVCRIALHAA